MHIQPWRPEPGTSMFTSVLLATHRQSVHVPWRVSPADIVTEHAPRSSGAALISNRVSACKTSDGSRRQCPAHACAGGASGGYYEMPHLYPRCGRETRARLRVGLLGGESFQWSKGLQGVRFFCLV